MATILQKSRLLQGLVAGDSAKTGPFYVGIGLTDRCNLRCVGCPYHSAIAGVSQWRGTDGCDIDVDVFKHLCEELRSMGTKALLLYGSGEPLLHNQIVEMVAFAKKLGFHITLITNGSLIDHTTAKALVETGLDVLRVSLWAGTLDQYRQNYPGSHPKNFQRVLDGLRFVSQLKVERETLFPQLVLYHVINRYNCRELDTMVDRASDTGCDGLFFWPMYDADGTLSDIVLSKDEYNETQRKLMSMRRQLDSLSLAHNVGQVVQRFNIANELGGTTPCYIAWFHVRVRADGSVQPCGRCDPTIDFGNLHNNTFREIWNGPAIQEFRRMAYSGEGMSSLSEHCDCKTCCYIGDILRVHRMFKWFRPFSACWRKVKGAFG